jgi:hypothetical protein
VFPSNPALEVDDDDDLDENDFDDDKKSSKSRKWVGISDLAIGGRCKCNGHASDCTLNTATGEMGCVCNHNTDGKECEKCKGKQVWWFWRENLNSGE